MYDVSAAWRSEKEDAENKIAELKKTNPDNYFLLPSFRMLQEKIRMANMKISQYESMINRGVKF